jgi:hypothetical protein
MADYQPDAYQSDAAQSLERATDALEAAIVQTRVPGELSEWVGGVSRALNEVYELLSHQVIPQHKADFSQILSNDLALEPRVQELSAVDEELCQQLDSALKLAATIEQALLASDGQLEANAHAERLFEKCMLLVIRVRKQEQAVNSWFVEALQRDRGVVD